MSRLDLATTLIVALCLGALGFLIYKAVQLYSGPDEPAIVEEPDPYYDTDYGDASDIYTDADSLDNRTEDNLNDELTYDEVSPTPVEEDTYDAIADDKAEVPTKVEKSATSSRPAAYGSGGDYMVIAGSYQQKINAENQVAKLKGMGYDNTRMEIFNGGALAVVLVNRFDTYSSARALYDELKGRGIEVFIKRKK